MGYPLRREMRDTLPRDLLTDGERHVLYEIADFADDKTRIAFPGMDELVRATHYQAESITACLARMAKKGVELRVAIGKDKNGRPVFACRGHRTTYHIPIFESVDNPGEGSTTVGPLPEKGSTTVRERVDSSTAKALPPSTPSPHVFTSRDPSSSASATIIQFVMSTTGANEDEANLLIEKLKPKVKSSLRGLLRTMADNGDLSTELDTLRASRPQQKQNKPPWCGGCNEQTRLRWSEAQQCAARCQVCHPLAQNQQEGPR